MSVRGEFILDRLRCGWVLAVLVMVCGGGVAKAVVPPNDICTAAIQIPGNGPFPHLTPMVDLTDALDNDAPTVACTNATRGVWYRITPAFSGFYEFSTCDTVTGTTEEDTVMSIYAAPYGCDGEFTLVGCADDSCRRQSEIIVELTRSVRYYILVWQFDRDSLTAGEVQLRANRLRAPANETCGSAVPLTLGVPVLGTTLLAENDYELGDLACFAGVGNEPVVGDLGDVVYHFVAPEAGDYSFRVSDYGGGNLVLYLAGSCPSAGSPGVVTDCIGAANRSTASSSEEVSCVSLTASQMVYVIVDEQMVEGRRTSGGGFILEASRCLRESEPNDFPQNANLFQCGIVGSIGHVDDQDFYYLGSPVAGSRVFAMVDGESASRTDFDLRITTETDVLEYDRQDNDVVFGNFSPNIAGVPLVGGASYAMVTFHAVPGFSGVEPYHLYAVVQPPMEMAAAEAEPNDLTLLANASVRNYFVGSLYGPAPSPDVDYFEFEAEAGDLLFLSLDCDPGRDETPVDAALGLLNASGAPLMLVDDPSDRSSTNGVSFFFGAESPYSPGEALVYRVLESGTYYAEVRIGLQASGADDGVGDYLLSIGRNCVHGSWGEASAPRFLSAVREESGVRLRLEGVPGASYRIEASEGIGADGWSTLGLGTADGTGRVDFEDTAPLGVSRFYRAVWP